LGQSSIGLIRFYLRMLCHHRHLVFIAKVSIMQPQMKFTAVVNTARPNVALSDRRPRGVYAIRWKITFCAAD